VNANFIRRAVQRVRSGLDAYRMRQDVPDAFWRRLCLANDIEPQRVRLGGDASLFLGMTHGELRLPKTPGGASLMAADKLLDELLRQPEWSVDWNGEFDALCLRRGQTIYLVDCFEEVFILHELFVNGDYDFASANEAVIVDVGANVGFTALFLAAANAGAQVIACEPLPGCCDRARRNFACNPHLSNRIALKQMALFNGNGEMALATAPGHRVQSSLVLHSPLNSLPEREVCTVRVRDAAAFIADVLETCGGRDLFLKMDCEGSEYAILDSLDNAGLLPRVSGIVMEWHRTPPPVIRDAATLRSVLLRAGFDTCTRGACAAGSDVGMLYAFRSGRGAGATP